MTFIFGIVFPLYAAIAIGYCAVRFGLFRPQDMAVLSRFVLVFAMPALLFRAVGSRPIAEVLHPGYMLSYLLGGLATMAAAYLWFTFAAADRRRRALAVLGSSCPNSGLIGYPLLLLLFPDIAGVVLGMNMLVENVVFIPLSLILMALAEEREQTPLPRLIRDMALDVLRRPMVIGLLAGLAVSAAGVSLPGPAVRLLDMLADATPALALAVIGGALVGLPMTGNRSLAVQIAAAKLLMHPALTAVAAALLLGAGLVALPDDLHRALILSAAAPMFSIYAALAQERGLGGAASIATLVATCGSFVTLSLVLLWAVQTGPV